MGEHAFNQPGGSRFAIGAGDANALHVPGRITIPGFCQRVQRLLGIVDRNTACLPGRIKLALFHHYGATAPVNGVLHIEMTCGGMARQGHEQAAGRSLARIAYHSLDMLVQGRTGQINWGGNPCCVQQFFQGTRANTAHCSSKVKIHSFMPKSALPAGGYWATTLPLPVKLTFIL